MLNHEDVYKRIFLFSTSDRDRLATKIRSLKWGVIGARRSDNLVSRFIGAATSIAIVDLRNVTEEDLKEIYELSNFIEANGFALIAALDIGDEDMVVRADKVGATHIIDVHGLDAYWEANLRSALDIVERLQSSGSSNAIEERQSRTINNSWTFNKNSHSLDAGAIIMQAINNNFSKIQQSNLQALYPKSQLLRYLSRYHRRLAISAYRRISRGDEQSAFSLSIGDRNYIHHIEHDDNVIRGYLEEVSEYKAWRSYDILTGVRSGNFARNHLFNWRKSEDGPLNMIIFGLRQLEDINTRFGRTYGNALIQQAADRICEALTVEPDQKHFVARISGKDFIYVSHSHKNWDQLQSIAENIIEKLTHEYEIDNEKFHMTVRASLNIALGEEDGIAVLRRANLALSDLMKHPNQFIVRADAPQLHHAQYDENIERELREAVEQNQIQLALQPQFDIDNGNLIGAEALARWDHPRLGKLGAAILFSVADRCDYRDIISQHIQNLAFKICSQWPSELDGLRLSINVTSAQMEAQNFAEEFIDAIRSNGFNPKNLTIELTEENLIKNIDIANKALLKLRNEGIKIAIDDFGTGYSSLAYITELPLDYLKLDKALIRNILRSDKDLTVLRSIIAMGKAVNLEIIAEGVETSEVLELLAKEKCHIYQGFFGSKPLSVAKFEKFAMRSA